MLRDGDDDGIDKFKFYMDTVIGSVTVEGTHSSKKANSSKMISEVPVNIFDNKCFTRAPRRIISEGLKLVAVAARIC